MNKYPTYIFLLACTLLVMKSVSACEETVNLDKAQARELLNTIQSDEADSLEKAFAIEDLVCAERSAVRLMAMQTALKSNDKAMRAKGLLETVLQRQNITVRFSQPEGLSKEAYEWLKTNAVQVFNVFYADRLNSCVSLGAGGSSGYKDKCVGGYSLDISGTVININYYGVGSGTFHLTDEGELVGEYFPHEFNQAIPAKIALF